MEIKQFRYSSDNFGYVIYSDSECGVIDGGAVTEILSFAEENNLDVKYILNTHSHGDHTVGNSALLSGSSGKFLSCEELAAKGSIEIGGEEVKIFETPGHTLDSVIFHIKTGGKDSLITGDTVFNGTIGNCFSGDLKAFMESVKKVLSFNDDTLIYAGHDYVKESIAFARTIDPENPHFDEFMAKYDGDLVVFALEDEKKVNPYLRFNDQWMIDIMKKRGLKVETEEERWNSIMHLY